MGWNDTIYVVFCQSFHAPAQLNRAFFICAGETNGLPSVAKCQRNGLDGVEVCWRMNRSEGRHLRYPQVIGTSRLGQPCNGIHHLFKTHAGGWSFYGEMMLKKQAGKWVWVDEPPPPEIAIAVNDHLALLQARPVEMTEVFGLAYNVGLNCKYWEKTTLRETT